jgi:phospholipase A1
VPAWRRLGGLAVGAALAAGLACGQAQTGAPCRAIADDRLRLACYDRLADAAPGPAPAATTPAPPPVAAVATAAAATATPAATPGERRDSHRMGSSLVERWELTPEQRQGVFLPLPYKPVYLLPVVVSDRVNTSPTSPNQANTVPVALPIDQTEAKFQLSLKTKVAEGLFNGNGDLWAAYTQSSRWQIYNAEYSRPFRETNYEPEAMLVFATDYSLLGLNGRLLGLSLNHQSNGRADPLSRSWNRVIGMVGFEQGEWSLMLRPWWRIPEAAANDNNADVEDHVGRAELLLARRWGNHIVSLQLRHSLRGGDRSRGSGELEYAFPLAGNLRGQLQLFSGYGESLIDYNFRQTRLGLGVSLVEWR